MGSPRNCRWVVTFDFLNGDAITDENMPFFVHLYALVVLLKTHSRPQSPRFGWSAVETRGSGNTAFRMS